MRYFSQIFEKCTATSENNVFLNSKQNLRKQFFTKIIIGKRKRIFVTKKFNSKIDFFIFSKQVDMGIKTIRPLKPYLAQKTVFKNLEK